MTPPEREFRSSALRDAMVRRDDAAALAGILAADVVLHSPILATPFEGRDAVAHLLSVVNDAVEDMRYTNQMADGSAEALMFRDRIGGQEIQGTLLIEFDDAGLIRTIDVFLRPLRAIAAFMSATGPGLARTPARARLVRLMSPVFPAAVAGVDAMARRNLRLR
jgi:hypothetical protein